MLLIPRVLILTASAAVLAQDTPPDIAAVLARLTEEADVFRHLAPQMLAEERLEQRATKPGRRFRPRVGAAALEPPKPEVQTRRIVSEYTFGAFHEAPGILHEMRQVVSVDGRKITTVAKAAATLTLGVRSADDRLKKRLLEQFEKHGLVGAATDFGQLILLFSKRTVNDFQFRVGSRTRIGGETILMLSFEQTGGQGALTAFEGREAVRQRIQGNLWVREPDYLPIRIMSVTTRRAGAEEVRDEGTVEYVQTPFGALAPASVVHRQIRGDAMVAENIFAYGPFRKFGVDSEIKFTEVPEAPPPK